MREYLYCDHWSFSKDGDFEPVAIPHDWLIGQEDLYEDSTGFYESRFTLEELTARYDYQPGEQVILCFDGIYMDSTIFINDKELLQWKYGYSAFSVNLTPYLQEENRILVKVVHMHPNSRWYSGAGIYRDVTLRFLPKGYLCPDSMYLHTVDRGEDFCLQMSVALGGSIGSKDLCLFTLWDSENRRVLETTGQVSILKEPFSGVLSGCRHEYEAKAEMIVTAPLLWDVDRPTLYRVTCILLQDGKSTDELTSTVGFRHMEFHPDKGFFLNGRKLVLHGVCEHHDHGCLGAAYNHDAMKRKLTLLKEMGANSLRTTHNMPARDVFDLCDEMGILVVAEAFDMWERSKTTYDYGRFFKDYYKKDVESYVCRDRNHPSLLLWSIGNEIYDTHADDHGQEITRYLCKEVRKHDPLCNAPITIGSNFMPWENAQKCADIVKFAGYNYGEKCYEKHHKEHPDWMIYGSETSSIVQSRGVYHFPLQQSILSDEDEQCSALGNSITSWGAKSMELCIASDRLYPFTMGQYIWTGFDYIGEPTPYHTRNSYFGQIDTAGFCKDSYYVYKAAWTSREKPFVYVFPYWNFNPGQMIDVRVVSNMDRVELFLNGKSLGKRSLNHTGGTGFIADFKVPYEEGCLKAVAYDEEGKEVCSMERHSFAEGVKMCASADRRELLADGRSLCYITISVLDAENHPVENAMNYVRASVEGPILIAGMDNGDSTDTDLYKCNVRKLFNGKLLLVVQAGLKTGTGYIHLESKGLLGLTLEIPVVECEKKMGIPDPLSPLLRKEGRMDLPLSEVIPIRGVVLESKEGCILTEKCPETIVTARILPENATTKKIRFHAVNDAGIEISFVKLYEVEGEPDKIRVKALGDGGFRIRALAYDHRDRVSLISSLEFQARGLGEAYLNPYEEISGGLYTETIGEIGNGNEKGFATARGERSGVIFRDIDFGEVGSDKVTLWIFALTSEEYTLEIWEGAPEEKSDGLLFKGIYQKPTIWNTYQEEEYTLSRKLKGIRSLSFVFYDKVHMRGFAFEKKEKAYEKWFASEADKIYGDSFTKEEQAVTGIGNNVTLEFTNMNFSGDGASGITLCGRSNLPVNTIHLRLTYEDGTEEKRILEFTSDKAASTAELSTYEERFFPLEPIKGSATVNFVFLPGSSFDFLAFQFGQGDAGHGQGDVSIGPVLGHGDTPLTANNCPKTHQQNRTYVLDYA